MRRVLSILLVLVFGLGPVAFAVGYDDSASLPACCRRHGSHHCAMDAKTPSEAAAERTAAFTAPVHCPLFPAHQSANPSTFFAPIHRPFAASLNRESALCAPANTFANGAANLCTFTLRGPPTPLTA